MHAETSNTSPFFPKANRVDNMTMGASELIMWLADIANNGLTTLYNQPNEFWDSITKRMVDAQLSGLSNRIKHIQNAIALENEEYVIDNISELYLLAKSIKKIELFSETEQLSFLKAGGFNITKKQLAHADLLQDEWLILGVVKGEEDKIKFRRTWIQGLRTKFMGQILDYAWGKTEFMQNWQAGKTFTGDMRVYPGAYKLRVAVESHSHSGHLFNTYAAYPDLEAFLKAYTMAIATNPVLYRFPVCLKEVSVQVSDQEVFLVDNQLNALLCKCPEDAKWGLVSASAGQKFQVFGEWDGTHFLPLSLICQSRFINLQF